MRVLVACEESQVVTTAFRARGHEAYSCDIQPCSGGHPEWHIMGDCLPLIDGDCELNIMRGGSKIIHGPWDLLIAHPPCTFLTKAGAMLVYNRDHTVKDPARMEKGMEARTFFLHFLAARCARIAVENPVPMRCFGLPKPSQIIEPWMFGDPWRKRTCLWLRGLPPLIMTEAPVEPLGLWVGSTSKCRDPTLKQRYALASHRDPRTRSKTFPGIARAMAEQWGNLNLTASPSS